MLIRHLTGLTHRVGARPALAATLAIAAGWPSVAIAQSEPAPSSLPPLRVVVNSTQDGPVEADDALTLREAIEIAHGRLSLDDLSPAERTQVSAAGEAEKVSLYENEVVSRIEFDLPPEDATIRLTAELPQLTVPGLVLTGQTQPGYDAETSPTADIFVPRPVVAITPASDRAVPRGLTIVADGVEVRGLSLYGFTAPHGVTAATPPADIFISHELPPPEPAAELNPARYAPFRDSDVPPKEVVIEENWLGLPPDESTPEVRSAFGVSIFNSTGATVARNRIERHDGSGAITSVRAENLEIRDNLIIGNGLAGMPDAIRLEGRIFQSEITDNIICGNDGSAIYAFKPVGNVSVRDNRISHNGRRLRRAAIYLTGHDHQVLDNTISHQAGPGIVIGAYPPGDRNLLTGNSFSHLEGLSIDLNTRRHSSARDFQIGDGPNPVRDTHNRRTDTGNSAIDAPQFRSPEFFVLNDSVVISGIVNLGSTVELYRVEPPTNQGYGPLQERLGEVDADETGAFEFASSELDVGDVVSAIATDPRYGTSEPALAAVVRSLDAPVALPEDERPPTAPAFQCAAPPELAQEPESEAPPESIQLSVPRLVHFAFDQSFISLESAALLDEVAIALRQFPEIVIELRGHADARGNDAYNRALGDRRARAVRDYLLTQGLDPARMTVRSLGEESPRSPGETIVDLARDRRVEIEYFDVRGLDIIFEDRETDLQPDF
ncbi:MAG: OmpA family protein [Cyanobacteria bacterium J06642_2]